MRFLRHVHRRTDLILITRGSLFLLFLHDFPRVSELGTLAFTHTGFRFQVLEKLLGLLLFLFLILIVELLPLIILVVLTAFSVILILRG